MLVTRKLERKGENVECNRPKLAFWDVQLFKIHWYSENPKMRFKKAKNTFLFFRNYPKSPIGNLHFKSALKLKLFSRTTGLLYLGVYNGLENAVLLFNLI